MREFCDLAADWCDRPGYPLTFERSGEDWLGRVRLRDPAGVFAACVYVFEREMIEAPVEEIDPNAPPPPCEGSIRLVASYVRTNAPDQSFAAITNATGTSLLYTAGMRVDDREVVEIMRNRVILRPSGAPLCSLSMFAEVPVATAPRVAPTPPVVVASPEAASAAETTSEGSPLSNCTGERLTVTLIGRFHRAASEQARLMAQAPISTMRPFFSAIGMNSSGGMSPRFGCRQRISASQPTTSLVLRLTIG